MQKMIEEAMKKQAQGKARSSRAPRARSSVARAPARKRRTPRYPGAGSRIGGSVGSALGNYIVPGVGGAVGGALGSVVGGGAQALVNRISGFGDYSVSKNSLVFNQDAVPEFSANNERCTLISHREFITDIRSGPTVVGAGTLFDIETFRINPTISETFPWLSSIGECYEQYVVQGMVFEFKSTSATAVSSTNTAMGTVVLATQYNSLSPEFTSKQQMENYEFSQSTVPSNSVLHPIECDPSQTQCGGIFNMYIPGGESGDVRLYDLGRFSIATVGMQAANTVIGELWVSYKICLLKPRITGVTEVADHWTLEASSITATEPLGDWTAAILSPSSTSSAENGSFTALTGINKMIINPAFFGVICVQLAYILPADASDQSSPTMTATGPITDVTSDYLGYSSAVYFNNVHAIVNGLSMFSIGYFKCQGGYTNSGLPMTITWNNMINIESPVASANLVIMSVPANLVD